MAKGRGTRLEPTSPPGPAPRACLCWDPADCGGLCPEHLWVVMGPPGVDRIVPRPQTDEGGWQVDLCPWGRVGVERRGPVSGARQSPV